MSNFQVNHGSWMPVISAGVFSTGCEVCQRYFSHFPLPRHGRAGSGLPLPPRLFPPTTLPGTFRPLLWPRNSTCPLRLDVHNIPTEDEKSRGGNFSNLQSFISAGIDEGKTVQRIVFFPQLVVL